MEHYHAIRKGEFESLLRKQIHLETIRLSEINQTSLTITLFLFYEKHKV